MSNFNDRQRSQEAKFALDEDLKFKVNARRNRLIGEWAASLMGKPQEEMAEYAKTVVKTGIGEGEAAVAALIRKDLGERASELTLLAKFEELGQEAREQVLQEMSI